MTGARGPPCPKTGPLPEARAKCLSHLLLASVDTSSCASIGTVRPTSAAVHTFTASAAVEGGSASDYGASEVAALDAAFAAAAGTATIVATSSEVASSSAAAKPSTRRIQDDYIINYDEVLGAGAFAQVTRGKCRKTGREVAIKVVKKRINN